MVFLVWRLGLSTFMGRGKVCSFAFYLGLGSYGVYGGLVMMHYPVVRYIYSNCCLISGNSTLTIVQIMPLIYLVPST